MAGPATPLRLSAAGVDLSPRVQSTTTVAASPTASTITAVASLTVSGNIASNGGVVLLGYGSFTVGTSGVSVLLQIRKTDTSGTVVGTTGAVTYTAADLGSLSVLGLDTSPTLPGQVYVLCATVASGAATSTFSAVQLTAIVL